MRARPKNTPQVVVRALACAVTLSLGATGIGHRVAQAAQPDTGSEALAAAAGDARVDSRLAAILLQQADGTSALAKSAGGGYGLPVVLRGHFDRKALEGLGAVVGTEAGSIVTADVPPEAMPAILAQEGVEEVGVGAQLEQYLNVSAAETGASQVWGFTPPFFGPPYSGYTGKDVVVGIVDTGLDLDHADFRNTSNQTRVKYLWDQTVGTGTPPAGFNYGAEWTSSQINAGQSTQIDTDGHGTYIAGIAAGNGRATGNGYPSYRYVGIAPLADIIAVKTSFFESKVIDGVNYCFTKAAAMGKDAVVLVAMGTQRGAHDGTSSLDVALSALTGRGKLIAAAVGNNAGQPIHSVVNLPNNGSTTLTFTIPVYPPQPTLIEGLYIEGWHASTASFRFKLTSPHGYTTNWINPNTTSGIVTTPDGILRVTNAMVTNSKGAKQVSVDMFDSGTYAPPPGTWKLDIQRLTSSTGLMDAWIASWLFGSSGVPPAFTSHIDYTKLVASPSTADSVIAVGAYTTKNSWINGSGGLSLYSDLPVLLDLTRYSSPGPRRDGVQRPDLAAPGYGVMAALSTDVIGGTSNTWRAETGVHRITKPTTGTSAAAAHVAGAIALLLDQTADLTPSMARSILRDRAAEDLFTANTPNSEWGYGKLRAAAQASTTVASSAQAAAVGKAIAYPNPTRGSIQFEFSLTDEQLLNSSEGVRIRIVDVQGREIAVLPGTTVAGRQSIAWDGRSSSGREAPPGVYFGHLQAGKARESWKFVRMS